MIQCESKHKKENKSLLFGIRTTRKEETLPGDSEKRKANHD